ncbi:tetratricopeptide repeat protein [Microcoleus sp. FACHB-672]|uniref:tetratricopeptide repeat protein n=1 Tax=Microcoleus sp. FACHB-672 TaxID=2692825 RepID=UPI001689D2B2|nr:hypothetical protein [Microcoleus sp. FACHB-672]MBD2043669.1 hypothetical protein [Microcoleus sp. FACHB-672]
MKKLWLLVGVSCLGSLFFVGNFSQAFQTSRVESSASIKLAQAQVSSECQADKNQKASGRVRQLLEQFQQQTYIEQTEKAEETLLQAFTSLQNLTDEQIKASFLEEIVAGSNNQPGVLSQILERYEQTGQKEKAQTLLSPALQLTQSLSASSSLVKTNALSSLAGFYAKLGQKSQAAELISQALQSEKTIQGAESKVKALTAIAKAYVAVNEFDKATQILSQALQFSQSVEYADSNQKAWVLEPIALSYAQAGNYTKAIEVAEQITDAEYYQGTALAGIANQYAQQGKLRQATQLATTIKMVQVQAKALTDIATTSVKNGNKDGGFEIFSQALKVAQTEPQPYNKAALVSEIVIQYAQAGEPDAAFTGVQAISEPQIKARTLGYIALQYAKMGQSEKAAQVANQAFNSVAEIKDARQKLDVSGEMLRNYTKAGFYNYAIQAGEKLGEVFKQAGNSLDLADGMLQSENLRKLSLQAIEAGNYDIALQAAQMIPNSIGYPLKNPTLYQVALAYAKTGQLDKAEQIARNMGNYSPFSQFQILAATALQAQNSALLSQTLQEAKAIADPEKKTYALAAIALETAKFGQKTTDSEIIAEALETAQTVDENTNLLTEISYQLIQAEKYEMALPFVKAIKIEDYKNNKLQEIAQAAIQSEQYSAAISSANALVNNPQAHARILLLLADKHIEAGQTDRVDEILSKTIEVTRTIAGPESQIMNVTESIQVDDEYDRASLYETIAIKYAEAKQYDRALQVTQNIQNVADRDLAQKRLACFR